MKVRRTVASFCKQKIEVSVRSDCWSWPWRQVVCEVLTGLSSLVVCTFWDQLFRVVSCSVVVEDFRTSLFSDCSLMKTVTSTKKSWCAALPTRKRKIKSIASSNWIDGRLRVLHQVQKAILHATHHKSKRLSSEHHRSPNLDGKKMLANPVERKEPTEPTFWTSWTTGFTSRKSDLETKNLFAKKAVHTNFRVDIREHAPFFRTSSPGLYENCNFRFAKRPYCHFNAPLHRRLKLWTVQHYWLIDHFLARLVFDTIVQISPFSFFFSPFSPFVVQANPCYCFFFILIFQCGADFVKVQQAPPHGKNDLFP